MTHPLDDADARQPIFNLPGVVTVMLIVLIGVHAAIALLPPDWQQTAFLYLAFIPARYAVTDAPGGWPAGLWTLISSALLHANVAHLVMNCVWLAAFGSPLARRLGKTRFLAVSIAGAVAGCLAFLALHFGEMVVVVGASAAVSAQMAAASRFVFAPGGPLYGRWQGGEGDYMLPASPLRELVRERRFLTFTGFWLVVNLAVGFSGFDGLTIAWEAHIGGYLVGLLLFPLLDPVPRELRY